jgi:hypothetical protein
MENTTKKVQCIPVEYSEKSVSPWGGLRFVQELIERMGLIIFLSKQDLPHPGSNRGYNPIEIILSFMVSIWLGGNRFAHCSYLRYDEVIRKMFGWKKVPSESTYSRFFRKFTMKRNNAVFPSVQQWLFEQFSLPKITLDLDSTILERYGKQEGSKKGYNPRKKGRPSQHPLIAFVSEVKLVVNGWLRPGNTSSSNNMMSFLEETFAILGKTTVGLLRADSGFSAGSCLEYFESKGVQYIVAAKFHTLLKKMLLRDKQWLPVKNGLSVTEFYYQASTWKLGRRCIAVRKDVDIYPDASGHQLSLFSTEGPVKVYRYSLLFTNLELPAYQVWNLYRQRSDAENRIKELKYDFAITGFCSEKFYATEAAFRFALLSYNIMAIFRLVALQDKKARRMATLYFKCIALGSWIVSKQRKKVLMLSVPEKKRGWIDGLFRNLADFHTPFPVSIA